MKLSVSIAIIAGLLASSAVAQAGAADSGLPRRSHHRSEYTVRYSRPAYQPTYLDRPIAYRPYGLVPFFFGLSFPYRTW